MARSYRTPDRTDRPIDPIHFDVDGREMVFLPPNSKLLLMAFRDSTDKDPTAQARAVSTQLDWLGAGLSDEDGQWILDRLRDPDDGFDVSDALAVAKMLIEEASNRPTPPPSDSSPRQGGQTSMGGRPVDPSIPANSQPTEPVTSPGTT
jgi:hypothetical protein